MAGFDTTDVASKVSPASGDPFKVLGGLADLQNSLNQNKMFQAKARIGQYQAMSTGPDGKIDNNKFGALVAADKLTAPFVQEGAKAVQDTNLVGTQNQSTAQAFRAQQLSSVQKLLAQTKDDSEVPGMISRAVAGKLIDPELAADILGGRVTDLNAQSLHSLRAQAIMAEANAQELKANIGTNDFINTGPVIKPVVVKTGLSGSTVNEAGGNADLTTGLTPGEANTPAYTQFNPVTHQPEIVTKAYAAAHPPEGPVPSEPVLGAAAAASEFSGASARQYSAELADMPNATRQINSLKQIEQLLQRDEGKTGPGTQVTAGWRNFILGNLPMFAGIIPGGATEAKIQSATQDELKKYMTDAAAQQASQYGQDTNFKLATAAAGNPNVDISNLANLDLTRMNIALRRADQARLAAFQETKQPPENYSVFASKWSREIDPRAFMLDLLTKQQRALVLKGITTDTGKQAFLNGKKAAEEAGLFTEKDIPR